MSHPPKVNFRSRLSKLIDRSPVSANESTSTTTSKFIADESTAAVRKSPQREGNDLFDKASTTDNHQHIPLSPLLSPHQQGQSMSFFPSMRRRAFSHDRPNSSSSSSTATNITKTASISSSSNINTATPSSQILHPPSPMEGDIYSKMKNDSCSFPKIVSPEPKSNTSHIYVAPAHRDLNEQSYKSKLFHLYPGASLSPSPSKFETFIQKAESKLAQREEMIVELTNQTAQQEEEILSLEQDIARLQKQLIQEQEMVQRDCTTTPNTTASTDTSSQEEAPPLQEEDSNIANLLNNAFHEFEVLTEERSDFVCLDATYVRRLCHQVYEFTITKKRMEKQLPFVKGMCDQIVESLRDQLASVEQKQTQVEHSRLNDLSTKSYEQHLEKQQLTDRLSAVLADIKKYTDDLEQENYKNKALRDALTLVETDKANFEMNMLNELSTLHAENEELATEFQREINLKSELATHMQETMEKTRFNYRASGLFAQSSKDDPNAIVLLDATQHGEQQCDDALATERNEVGVNTATWGLPSSSVVQAFRRRPSQPNTFGFYPGDNKNNDYNNHHNIDDYNDYNLDLQHQQSFSITPQSREEKIWSRTYHQTRKALNILTLVESLIAGKPIITETSTQQPQCAQDVASNVNEMIKRMISKIERITGESDVKKNRHASKSLLLVTARDNILSMLSLPDQDEQHQALIEAILVTNLFIK
jgi:hypothetical protein